MGKYTNNQLRKKVQDAVNNIGDLIKNTRGKDITIADLSKRSGISSSVISDMENHKGAMPNVYTIITLANALNLPEETFLNLIWKNINKNNTVDNMGKLEKLKTSLIEYGLPTTCIDRVLNYIDFFVTLENLQNDFSTISAICQIESLNGASSDKKVIDPTILNEIQKNIDKIEKIKRGIKK